jgi:hypothetical protein
MDILLKIKINLQLLYYNGHRKITQGFICETFSSSQFRVGSEV